MCIIFLYNLIYIYKDIINFVVCDNYWCVVFEKVVKYYVKKLRNCKGIVRIFVFLEVRREFLTFFGSIEWLVILVNMMLYR